MNDKGEYAEVMANMVDPHHLKTPKQAHWTETMSLLWCFFIWPDALTALKMVGSVFTTFNYGAFFTTVGTLGLTGADWIILAAALLTLL